RWPFARKLHSIPNLYPEIREQGNSGFADVFRSNFVVSYRFEIFIEQKYRSFYRDPVAKISPCYESRFELVDPPQPVLTEAYDPIALNWVSIIRLRSLPADECYTDMVTI